MAINCFLGAVFTHAIPFTSRCENSWRTVWFIPLRPRGPTPHSLHIQPSELGSLFGVHMQEGEFSALVWPMGVLMLIWRLGLQPFIPHQRTQSTSMDLTNDRQSPTPGVFSLLEIKHSFLQNFGSLFNEKSHTSVRIFQRLLSASSVLCWYFDQHNWSKYNHNMRCRQAA